MNPEESQRITCPWSRGEKGKIFPPANFFLSIGFYILFFGQISNRT
jgi:hypothetical protein